MKRVRPGRITGCDAAMPGLAAGSDRKALGSGRPAGVPDSLRRIILPRIPLPTLESMTPEQRRVRDTVVAGPRGELVGPLRAALHNPSLAEKWSELGAELRYRTSLPPRLSELAILVTARARSCHLEWHIHAQMAANAGLPADLIEDIRNERRPRSGTEEDLEVYDFARELNERNIVGNAAYDRIVARWKPVGAVELTALVGYYTLVAMTLNNHGLELPEGAPEPFPALSR